MKATIDLLFIRIIHCLRLRAFLVRADTHSGLLSSTWCCGLDPTWGDRGDSLPWPSQSVVALFMAKIGNDVSNRARPFPRRPQQRDGGGPMLAFIQRFRRTRWVFLLYMREM